jgi:hypothetical protein
MTKLRKKIKMVSIKKALEKEKKLLEANKKKIEEELKKLSKEKSKLKTKIKKLKIPVEFIPGQDRKYNEKEINQYIDIYKKNNQILEKEKKLLEIELININKSIFELNNKFIKELDKIEGGFIYDAPMTTYILSKVIPPKNIL